MLYEQRTIPNFRKSTFRTCRHGVPVANRLWGPNARDGFPYMQPTDGWRDLQTTIHLLPTVDSRNYFRM